MNRLVYICERIFIKNEIKVTPTYQIKLTFLLLKEEWYCPCIYNDVSF